MKGVKGKVLKKLKSIKPIGYLKQERVFHVNALDGFLEVLPKSLPIPNPLKAAKTQLGFKEEQPKVAKETSFLSQENENIYVSEHMRDLEKEEEMDIDDDFIDDKENIWLPVKRKSVEVDFGKEKKEDLRKMELSTCRQMPLEEIDISSFRRPDLNCGSLFDPNLLAAFDQAVKEHVRMSEVERRARFEEESFERIKQKEEMQASVEISQDLDKRREARMGMENLERCLEEPPLKAHRIEEEEEKDEEEEEEDDDDGGGGDPLLQFEERCPPRGSGSVILYTTTLRGIRKTFEDCCSIRFLLESFRVLFYERDVSMHLEYKEELWRVLEGKAIPPKLFIKGRYVGGAEEVLGLHEQGKFRMLFEGIPIDRSNGLCEACTGIRFVLCFNCRGSNRFIADDGSWSKCQNCNENGLIICPICC